MIDAAKNFLEWGFSPVPINKLKAPTFKHLQALFVQPMLENDVDKYFKDSWGVSLVCGLVSGGLEALDFDGHDGKDIKSVFNEYIEDKDVKFIVLSYQIPIVQTPSGGFHIYFRCREHLTRRGATLAKWEDNTPMIELKSRNQLITTVPSPGYKFWNNYSDFSKLPDIPIEVRDTLIAKAEKLNQGTIKTYDGKGKWPESWNTKTVWGKFNEEGEDEAKELLILKGWQLIRRRKDGLEYWLRPGKNEGFSATYGYRKGMFYVFSSSAPPFQDSRAYNHFDILRLLKFDGSQGNAIEYLKDKYQMYEEEEIEAIDKFIRVGTDYYKIIFVPDRNGILRREIKSWKRAEITLDYGTNLLKKIKKYDGFVLSPDNNVPLVNKYKNFYNIYNEFTHIPAEGDWKWSRILMEHVFGEQFNLGMRYMKILYEHPDRKTVILVLVSKKRQTGKTTFLNWLNMIFAGNMAIIDSSDLTDGFNSIIAMSNIVAVDETIVEKNTAIEKIKAIATQKVATVNMKFVDKFKLPNYTKLILTSNKEDDFMKIDEEEIRFFIRRLDEPKIINHNIEEDLLNEIPAFLYALKQMPPVNWSVSRSGFRQTELDNRYLRRIKHVTKSWLYHEVYDYILDYFNEHTDIKEFATLPLDMKRKLFAHNSKVSTSYLSKVFREEFMLTESNKNIRFHPTGDLTAPKKVGRPFIFTRDLFPEAEPYNPSGNSSENDIPF